MSDTPKPGLPGASPEPAAPYKPEGALTRPAATAVTKPEQRALALPPGMPPGATPQLKTWSARRPIWIGVVTVILLLIFFIGWGMMTTISGAVVASGVIQVEQNRQVVQHPDGGIVAEIHVAEGQTVKAGDMLMRLDGTQVLAELAIVEGQLYEAMARKARLEAERDDGPAPIFPADLLALAETHPEVAEQVEGQRRLFTARRDTVDSQISQLRKRLDQIRAQADGVRAQIAANDDQMRLLGPEIASKKKLLDQGLTQSGALADLQREEARLTGNKGELAASLAQTDGRATEIELQILQIQSARREEANTQLRDMGDKTLELAERRRALREKANRLDIRAPVSGIVLGLTVTTPQAVIRSADPLLYLIPQDRPLIIVIQIPPIHVDEIHIGEDVEISFAAFSARTTPQLKGTLTSISADAITDQATHQNYYRGEVALQPGEMAKLDGQTLLPGMPVQAYVSTGDRSPMAYLFKPFWDYAKLAFREN
jgi:HlyD family secretion protein